MGQLRVLVFAVAILSFVADAACPGPRTCPSNSCRPCHPNDAKPKSTCELVRLPGSLCSACSLKAPKPDGTFVDATAIYDIDNVECKKRLKRYARQNKCDSERITPQTVDKAFNGNKQERERIDYLLYSVCEECCDCIPKGIPKSDTGATSLVRGNCPAHAHFDICRIHPKVKWIVKGKNSPAPDLSKLLTICEDFKQWSQSKYFPGWGNNQNIVINQDIKDFLSATLKAVECKKSSVWNKCYDLEHTQDRVR